MIRRIKESKLLNIEENIVFEIDSSKNPITITLPISNNSNCITLVKISNDINNIIVTTETDEFTINEGQIIGFGGNKYKGKGVTLQFNNNNWEIVKFY